MGNLTVNTVVIGAGPGGYVCGIKLGQLGIDTLVVEGTHIGGVCLNVGCIPSKALIQAAKAVDKAAKASEMGITFGAPSIDYDQLQAWKGKVVKRLTGGVGTLLTANKVKTLSGMARFTSPHTLLVEGEEGTTLVQFTHAVIATGSYQTPLRGFDVDGEHVWGSTEALAFTEKPERLAVIGGGYIGLELGQMFARLGSKLTIIEYTDGLLPGFDREVVRLVERKLRKVKAKVHTGAAATGWRKEGDELVVTYKKGDAEHEVRCDKVLVTVGRRPRTAEVGLDAAGVRLDGQGFIGIDDQCRTSQPHIFAIGDVAGQPMLAHKASREGEIAAEVIAGHTAGHIYKTVPAVVFTDPEIAQAGLSEAQAKEKGYEIKVGKYPFGANGRALASMEGEGFVKIITDKADGQVLGVIIVGPNATDLISEAALAIEMDAFAEDLMLTIHPHPTLGEAMMEAAAHALGQAVHIVN